MDHISFRGISPNLYWRICDSLLFDNEIYAASKLLVSSGGGKTKDRFLRNG